jgi:hypothetical protein
MKTEKLVAAVLLVLLLAAAFTVDAVHNGYGLKSDEASYTAMALSVAYDGDLAFERKDLERYWAVYTCGPDGAFLKRGKQVRVKLVAGWPFVRVMRWGDAPLDRLYFGKAYIYPVFAAPFVRVLGLRGFLVFHLLLLAGVAWLGYLFLSARSPGPVALTFVLAFLGASIVPVYGVWFTPEIFNLSLVFFAYFLWLYKEVAPPAERQSRLARFVRGPGSDLLAVALLGMVAFSKPLYVPLAAPVVAWPLWGFWSRGAGPGLVRRVLRAALLGVGFVAVAGGLFAVNAAISGEFNYQGGNRKVFYTTFPHQTPAMTFATVGYSNTTNQLDRTAVLDKQDIAERYARNLVYFVVGRHHGLLPYFFPGLLAVVLWWWRWREIRGWHLLMLLAVLGTVAVTLAILPYTWNGGGGPPGNRYFMAVYPVLFFFLPPIQSFAVPLVAWAGGALFTAQLVLNPYYTARFPYFNLDHGAVRLLPIELTLVNDLPIMLERNRVQIRYGSNPELSLYLLDRNAYPPEPAGVWFAGRRRGDVIVRAFEKLSSMRLRVTSAVDGDVWLSFAGQDTTLEMKRGQSVEVTFTDPEGVYSDRGYGYVLSVKPSNGTVPKNNDPTTSDRRFLGALVNMQGSVHP